MSQGCPSRKRSYPSQYVARNARWLISEKYKLKGNTRLPKKEYECPRCGQWHLTSKS